MARVPPVSSPACLPEFPGYAYRPTSVVGIPLSTTAIMDGEPLSAREAARRLGISVTTLYDWFGQSDRGLLVIRGQRVTVDYSQGGPKGEGRILIEPAEVKRLKDLMRVRPQFIIPRRPLVRCETYPGIVVPLGRPR
jgi:hypothetical protein